MKGFKKMEAVTKNFRQSFKISREKITWYPGHMDHSFKQMQAIMRKIDCVLEVHDARIPFSGRNSRFLWNLIGEKPHILVLNKCDLINKFSFKTIKEKCHEENCANVVFTNCMDSNCNGLNEIIPKAARLIKGDVIQPKINPALKMMVVGVPNVGKSSLINALRSKILAKGRATRVGPNAGVTKAVQTEIKIYSDPPMYLIDTPGILTPMISDDECGMKLALCSCLNDAVVGIMAIADFLLYWMNKTKNFVYVEYFGLKQPIDDIFPLLVKIAVDKNYMKKVKNFDKNTLEIVPNVDLAATFLVSLFRKGKFGDLCLDKNHL